MHALNASNATHSSASAMINSSGSTGHLREEVVEAAFMDLDLLNQLQFAGKAEFGEAVRNVLLEMREGDSHGTPPGMRNAANPGG